MPNLMGEVGILLERGVSRGGGEYLTEYWSNRSWRSDGNEADRVDHGGHARL